MLEAGEQREPNEGGEPGEPGLSRVTELFAGKVVRKDLVRKIKAGANVPVYVLEYLLGKYCATDDPAAIEAGMRLVNYMLAENFVRPDEANKVQSMVREKGKHTLIDKVKVRYSSEEDKYWAELVQFGHRNVHIPENFIRQYDRLLVGGVWAQLDIKHVVDEDAKGKKSPFWIDTLKPIQLATFDLEEYQEGRKQVSTDEWIDLLIRSVGLEPSYFERRLKLLFLTRLIPLCEQNFNFVELGPRGTGKSYGFQELSPYTILLTGPTTVANLFYNIASNKMGLVGLWDAVAFDEVADLQKMPKEVVTTLKTYCESGTFARGKEALTGHASIAMFGNTNQPVDLMVRSSHLFAPLPDVIREDMAFLDRLHFYLPGWEVPKMRMEFFTDGYGFVVDYLAEALKELRKHNFTEMVDRYFTMGSHLNARDVKAVRRTVSGLIKLIYPHGVVAREEMAELLELALEGRRRVKEQLKKMGSFEYHQTSFSYKDRETMEERYVGVPEEGGHNLISTEPLAPGSVYTASVDDQSKVGLYRIEVGCAPGTGKLRIAGGVDGAMKESLQRAFAYLQASKATMGISQLVDTADFHVQAIDLLANRVGCEAGIALLVAIQSALRKQPVLPAMLVLGDLTITGNLKEVRSLAEPLRVAMDNGARRALLPIENKRSFFDVPADVVERVDPVFYGDAMTATLKALGMS
ncbi:MAG: protease Lon-related BREX system protein BrxL [Chloroflexota bacterium]